MNSITPERGHFLDCNVGEFDAQFFNITPQEARAMDPQQRLLLEVSYEAFENAGLTLQSLAGSATSCYVGAFTSDYRDIFTRDPEAAPKYTATGNSSSILSNRLSWFYDLRGPSMTVDTACSSSLVALHLACQSLRTGESRAAIVGGANLILSPESMMWLSNLNSLGKDGVSRTFDSCGNGYGRGEGFAIIVLKPLRDAVTDGDTIRAVIRGTGINQDGRTTGITLPSSEAQADLIRSTYLNAGLDMTKTRYFEAHGTGTAAGDPIEFEAIAKTVGAHRSKEDALFVGSVKENVGHLEGAAGLAAVLKSVMMLEKGMIPPSVHFKNPNPKLSLHEHSITVPLELTGWPTEGLRRISVNTFGFGGTNSHVIIDDAAHSLMEKSLQGRHRTILNGSGGSRIAVNHLNGSLETNHAIVKINGNMHDSVEQAETTNFANVLDGHEKAYVTSLDEGEHADGISQLFVFSSADREAGVRRIKDMGNYLRKKLENRDAVYGKTLFSDLAYTLAEKSSHLPWRSFVVGDSPERLLAALKTTKVEWTRAVSSPTVAFVFTGQGAQWVGMGRELLSFPQFYESLKAADKYLRSLGASWSVLRVLHGDVVEAELSEAYMSQPVCTVLQVALVDLLRSWSIVPSAVVGHSSGEIAASYAAGYVSREDVWKIAYWRGTLSSQVKSFAPGLRGSMAAIGLSANKTENYIKVQQCRDVVIACVNSLSSVTVSGDDNEISDLVQVLKDDRVFARKLRVQNAYHSAHMRVIADPYLEAIKDISKAGPGNNVRMYSSVTGQIVSRDELSADYWVRNLTSPVLFSKAVESMVEQKSSKSGVESSPISFLVEIGPRAALKGPLRQTLAAIGSERVSYCSILEANTPGVESIERSAGLLFQHGINPKISIINRGSQTTSASTMLIDLPVYSWNHSNVFWSESRVSRGHRLRQGVRHEILGVRVPDFDPLERRWRNRLRLAESPWLRDHKIQNSILYPAAGHIVMVIEAARQIAEGLQGVASFTLREVRIDKAILLSDDEDSPLSNIEILLSIRPRKIGLLGDAAPWFEFCISSAAEGESLQENCSGLLMIDQAPKHESISYAKETESAEETHRSKYSHVMASCTRPQSPANFYQTLSGIGLNYGPEFQLVTSVRRGKTGSCATVKATTGSASHYLIHPATLDAIFQTSVSTKEASKHRLEGALVPVSFGKVTVSASLESEVPSGFTGYAESSKQSSSDSVFNISMWADASVQRAIGIQGFKCRELSDYLVTSELQNVQHDKICGIIEWKPDVAFLSNGELKTVIEAAAENQRTMKTDGTVSKLDAITYSFISDLLENISTADVKQGDSEVFFRWMQDHKRLGVKGQLDFQIQGLESPQLGTTEAAALINELKMEHVHGRALCTIGENIKSIITGNTEPLELLLEDDLLTRFYAEARMIDVMNIKLTEVSAPRF